MKKHPFFLIHDRTQSLLLCLMDGTQQKPVIILHTLGNGAFLAASTEEQRLPIKDSNTRSFEGLNSLFCSAEWMERGRKPIITLHKRECNFSGCQSAHRGAEITKEGF